jgi:hypothetical protein
MKHFCVHPRYVNLSLHKSEQQCTALKKTQKFFPLTIMKKKNCKIFLSFEEKLLIKINY